MNFENRHIREMITNPAVRARIEAPREERPEQVSEPVSIIAHLSLIAPMIAFVTLCGVVAYMQ